MNAREQKPSDSAAPVPALQLVDREQLRVSLKAAMTPATFANWLHRAIKDHGFPEPIRTGKRSCAWSVPEVQAWLVSRPRKGVFSGVRHRHGAPPAA